MTTSDVIRWATFVGAWLLFMGPIYQAALELGEENDLRERLDEAMTGSPSQVSAWWWLVPPVHYVLQRRRSKEFRDRVMSTLDPELIQSLVAYLNAATGWLYVGLGGLLIAIGETGELVEHEEWSPAVYVILAVVMILLSAGNVALRMGRGHSMVDKSRGTRPGLDT